ncbi:NAD(P)-dependent oxidoreductase [Ideonella sp. BN130291]|uniref:NAD(P)-dependent oxidoreductase n=1 Tax=Ideonella sp. BN130291 TaxID=3112940 RepID=UPI002E267599|nr:NAD(P)-dependent oxidoreductase [Ideonella sp. BN130291]
MRPPFKGMTQMTIGFVGLGIMGLPMAMNLARSGAPLMVWNRSPEKCQEVAALGARVAATPRALFSACDVVILMLAHDDAMDEVLQRGTPGFSELVRGRTLVNMGTTSAQYATALAQEVAAVGGTYLEAPVSGSRKPAEAGQLVGMIAGDAAAIERVRPLLAPMCKEVFVCGAVPGALLMKLSVNLFLITMVTGLCEATHFAREHRLDLEVFRAVLDAGPMASSVSKVKLAKLVDGDAAPQASITDVLKNSRLVAEQARHAGVASPLLDICHRLFAETEAQGHGREDMISVVRAIEARTRAASGG